MLKLLLFDDGYIEYNEHIQLSTVLNALLFLNFNLKKKKDLVSFPPHGIYVHNSCHEACNNDYYYYYYYKVLHTLYWHIGPSLDFNRDYKVSRLSDHDLTLLAKPYPNRLLC